jgi:hypothetical protein
MKNLSRTLRIVRQFFLLLCAFVLGFKFTAHAADKVAGRNFIIYCAPNLPQETKKVLESQIQYFIAGGTGASNTPKWGMRVGDTLTLVDGSRLVQIGETLKIPENARTPALQFKSGVKLIQAFLKFLEEGADPARPPSLPTSDLNIPRICADEATQAGARVLWIGSPLYFDDVAAHDMREGWLSDGYFNQDRAVTTFSVAGKQDNLKGATVRFCTLEVPWATANKLAHQEMIRRFWTLFINECGGNLIAFSPDLSKQLELLASEEGKPLTATPPRDKEDRFMAIRRSLIEMVRSPEAKTLMVGQDLQLDVAAAGLGPLTYQWKKNGSPILGATTRELRIAKASVTDSGSYSVLVISQSGSSESPAATVAVNAPAQTAPTSLVPAPAVTRAKPSEDESKLKAIPDWVTITAEEYRKNYPSPKGLPNKDNVRIALIWQTDSGRDVDLDLHIRPSASKEELSWRNPKSSEGAHYKDFSNPKASHGFELVDIDVPVVPENLAIWVNAFSGQAPKGFRAEVRVLYGGALTVYPVTLSAQKGNQGGGAAQRGRSPHWASVTFSR